MRPFLLVISLLLTACATTKPIASVRPVILTEQDNNKTLNIAVGESFVIRLNENPTTGYVWAVNGQNESLVLQSSDYVADAVPNDTGKILVGGGGKRSFSFVAQKSGTAILKLKHWRPWEGDASIVDTFSVEVQI